MVMRIKKDDLLRIKNLRDYVGKDEITYGELLELEEFVNKKMMVIRETNIDDLSNIVI
jgi:hypothetical protein